MSSTESFLLMMKQVEGTKLVGARSYGASGNPKAIRLSNGIDVYLPTWKLLTIEGAKIEGKGIAPDHEIAASPEDFQQGDPVRDAALRILRAPKDNSDVHVLETKGPR